MGLLAMAYFQNVKEDSKLLPDDELVCTDIRKHLHWNICIFNTKK